MHRVCNIVGVSYTPLQMIHFDILELLYSHCHYNFTITLKIAKTYIFCISLTSLFTNTTCVFKLFKISLHLELSTIPPPVDITTLPIIIPVSCIIVFIKICSSLRLNSAHPWFCTYSLILVWFSTSKTWSKSIITWSCNIWLYIVQVLIFHSSSYRLGSAYHNYILNSHNLMTWYLCREKYEFCSIYLCAQKTLEMSLTQSFCYFITTVLFEAI